jgi:co-chaperonin GroES (HSP10)
MLGSMQAVNYYLVVENIKQPPKKVGGLLIADDEEDRYTKAKVISVGNLVEGVKESNIVYYDKHAGHSIQWKDILYYVIKIGDIVLID